MESWQPPGEGFLKVNCDGSLCIQNGRLGFGVVVRDIHGVIIAVKADFMEGRMRVVDVEGYTILLAMRLVLSKKWRKVIFETDSLLVVEGLTRHCLDATSMNKWGAECLTLLSDNKEWLLHHTMRASNECANKAARKANYEGWRWDNDTSIPWIFGDFSRDDYQACLGR